VNTSLFSRYFLEEVRIIIRTFNRRDRTVDWTTLGAALAGGLIGLTGEIAGRIGSRRQAERARELAIEDAERMRSTAIEDDRRREADARARKAADIIFDSFRLNPIRRTSPIDEEAKQRARTIVITMWYEIPHFPNVELRRRLLEIEHILDIADAGVVFKHALPELVFTARIESFKILGAWLRREEELPPPTEGWAEVLRIADEAIEQWDKNLARKGISTKTLKLNELGDLI
jgi:hypothetical protein